MITSKENLEAINKMNKELIEKQLKRETARGRAYQMGFEVGKQQATKELLDLVEDIFNNFFNEFDLTSYTKPDDKLFKRLWSKYHEQLSKLGEQGK